MYRAQEKENKPYRLKLTQSAKRRYLDKLADIQNKDPYELPAAEWHRDLDRLPPCTYPDVLTYLVYGVSYYTLQDFQSHKSLESYEAFCYAWV